MAGSVNKVILVGNLGADPEIRRTQDGRPIANLRLATSESWRDKTTGERQGKNRVASRRHLQRKPVPDRRAISQEGLEGLPRRRVADAQMAGPGRPGPLFHRGRAAGLSRRADLARSRRRGGRGSGGDMDEAGGDFGSPGPTRKVAAAAGAGSMAGQRAAATWTTRFRSEGRSRHAHASLRPSEHCEREPELIVTVSSWSLAPRSLGSCDYAIRAVASQHVAGMTLRS